jgi:hypothetical protein
VACGRRSLTPNNSSVDNGFFWRFPFLLDSFLAFATLTSLLLPPALLSNPAYSTPLLQTCAPSSPLLHTDIFRRPRFCPRTAQRKSRAKEKTTSGVCEIDDWGDGGASRRRRG